MVDDAVCFNSDRCTKTLLETSATGLPGLNETNLEVVAELFVHCLGQFLATVSEVYGGRGKGGIGSA